MATIAEPRGAALTLARPTAAEPGTAASVAAKIVRQASLWLALLFALCGIAVLLSWSNDQARLRDTARSIVAGEPSETGRVTKLVDWVYHNQGFAKNRHYFLWNRLEATPIQVLEHGGDCADKSRLTASLLRGVGIPASLAMVKGCPTCKFGHTVALAQTAGGWTPVDSVYDITFPDGTGRLTPIERLRADPTLQARRIAQQQARLFPDSKILYFSLERDPFTYVTTVNWDKYVLTRTVAAGLRAVGVEPWRVPRPRVLDDPKLFVASACFAIALVLAIVAFLSRRTRAHALARSGALA